MGWQVPRRLRRADVRHRWLDRMKTKIMIALVAEIAIGVLAHRTWQARPATASRWRTGTSYVAYSSKALKRGPTAPVKVGGQSDERQPE